MTHLGLGLSLLTERTREREFLDGMRRVVPWLRLTALIEPHYPMGNTGRPPFQFATMRKAMDAQPAGSHARGLVARRAGYQDLGAPRGSVRQKGARGYAPDRTEGKNQMA